MEFFNIITLSYEHGFAKPHYSIFIVTTRRMGTIPSYFLHVGDDPISDIQGARNVGMRTVFIKRGDVIAYADIRIERLGELTMFLSSRD